MPTSNAANNALQVQVTALGESMQNGFNELKVLIQGIDQRLRAIETTEAGCQPMVNLRLQTLEQTVRGHGDELRGMRVMRTIAVWALSLFTAALTMVLVALVTGKAYIVFR